MKTKPKVTVVIPTFNRAGTLGRAIDSVLSQKFKDFELIIVDDGSTDGTPNVVGAYSDDRIKYIKYGANLGQSAALNTGIAEAVGEIISFLDSDDVWLSSYLSRVVDKFDSNPNVGFVYSRFLNGPEWRLEGENKYPDVLKQGFLSSTITLSVKKSALNQVGRFNPTYSMCNDDDLCFRLAREFSFALIPEGLAVVVASINSISRNRVDAALGWEKLFLDYKGEIIQTCGYKVIASRALKLSSYFFRCRKITKGCEYLVLGCASLFRSPDPTNPFSKGDIVRIPLAIIRSLISGLKWRDIDR